MQPINYIQDFNPAQNFIQGLQAGQGILQNRQALAANELALKQAEEKRKQQEELKSLINNPNTTADDLFKIAASTNNNEALQYAKSLDDRAKKDVINHHLQIMNAVRTKQPEIAIPIIEQKILAAKNSGDVIQEEENKQILERFKQNPEATANLLGASLFAVDGGAEALKAWSDMYATQSEQARKANESQSLIDQRRSAAEKSKADMEKTKAELASLTDGNKKPLDTKQRFESELDLRKQYDNQTKGYVDARTAYDNLVSSADANIKRKDGAAENGAADIALITAFMKTLDPNSVVRETEFATARNTAGLYEELKNQAGKLEQGSLLNDEQRKRYRALAGQYMKAAEQRESRVRQGLMPVIRSYGLDENNVFTPLADSVTIEDGAW